jgi:serine/threonine protein kinase
MGATAATLARVLGRYAIFGEIASGGMASVHFGRLRGEVGFSRTVAIKQLHPHHAREAEFVAMFLDEARLAARIQHPNVVSTLDVVATEGELILVMEYVAGETLGRLLARGVKSGTNVPPRVAVAILSGVLRGLQAAHDAKSERGEPLNIVHRDISPQNILVGVDGTARVLDFGIAKAADRLHATREGVLKGKLPYMAPEHFHGDVTCQSDVYAAAIVLWEMLTSRRLFSGATEALTLAKVMRGDVEPPSKYLSADVLPAATLAALDQVVLRGLAHDLRVRYASARDMANELERCLDLATDQEVGTWVMAAAGAAIAERSAIVAEIEIQSSVGTASLRRFALPGVAPTSPDSDAQKPLPISFAKQPAAGDARLPLLGRSRARWAALVLVVLVTVTGRVVATRASHRTEVASDAPPPQSTVDPLPHVDALPHVAAEPPATSAAAPVPAAPALVAPAAAAPPTADSPSPRPAVSASHATHAEKAARPANVPAPQVRIPTYL